MSPSESLEFSRRAIVICHAAGIRDQADIDLFSAMMNGMAHQQVADDPGGSRWADHAERAVEVLLAFAAKPAAGPNTKS